MKDPQVFLLHIKDAIERILRYAPADRAAFLANTMVQDAVIRNLEIIGEAVKQLPRADLQQHSHIPWTRVAGMRDVLIHKYFGVDLETVWNVIQVDLPPLLQAIDKLWNHETPAAADASNP